MKDNQNEIVESFIGAIFCSLICVPISLGAVTLFIAECLGKVSPEIPIWIRIVVYPAAIIDTCVLWQTWRYVRNKRHPVSLNVALSVPSLPRLVSIGLGLFWLIHLLFCIQMNLVSFDSNFSTFEDGFASIVTPLIWSIGVTYSFNIFLLLAIFSIMRRKSIVKWIWSHRWWINVSIGGACTIIGVVFREQIEKIF